MGRLLNALQFKKAKPTSAPDPEAEREAYRQRLQATIAENDRIWAGRP